MDVAAAEAGLGLQLVEASPTDSEASYVPGSVDDFDRLYRASYHRLLYALLAVTGDYQAAEDCVQEAFVKAYHAWPAWKPDAPAEAWLHRIGLNVAYSYLRWRKLRELPEIVRRLGRQTRETDPEDMALRGELLAALRKLPPDQAAAIVLRFHHGYTNRDMAHALGVPESTIASRVAAAKERLRQELRELA